MILLEEILSAREARARRQRAVLAFYPTAVQLALNIPGENKRLEGDMTRLQDVVRNILFDKNLQFYIEVIDACGACILIGLDAQALQVKKTAVAAEETLPYGRLLDIDVITKEGALTRKSIGQHLRKCLLCEEEAKICARLRAHSTDELKKEVLRLWDKKI